MQIISKLQAVFVESGLPLWLRPFEVMITSSHAALIEVITDAPSIHSLKSRLPRGTSIRDHFKLKYGAALRPVYTRRKPRASPDISEVARAQDKRHSCTAQRSATSSRAWLDTPS